LARPASTMSATSGSAQTLQTVTQVPSARSAAASLSHTPLANLSPYVDAREGHRPPQRECMSRHNTYLKDPEQLIEGNSVTLLRDGQETYPAMLNAIAAAQKTVVLETYILACDRIGWRFADALVERAQEGVEVSVLVDAVGSSELSDEFLSYLREGKVRLQFFNPVTPWKKRWGLNSRDHRKILVVDNKVGFIGGINISLDYAPQEDGGEGWRDTHCKIEGPLVQELSRIFVSNWRRLGGEPLAPALHFSTPPPQGELAGSLLENELYRKQGLIQRTYLHAIEQAKQSILITNAYFIPDARIILALRRACRRGVRVEIMVPRDSDVEMVWYASKALYGQLLSWGVVIREWHNRMLHAKTAVIDGIWCTIGSSNLDHRSLIHNREANVVFADPRLGEQLVQMFEADCAHTSTVDRAAFAKRPWKQKILEKLCYLFQYWL
jgi:cardiolipin synthase